MENEIQQQTEQDEPQPEAGPAGAAREARPLQPSSDSREDRPRRRGRFRRRVCPMCENKISFVDYKDFNFLRRFISDRGRIESRRKSGACSKHQRALAQAIKRARHLALLPYTAEHIRASGVGYYR
jgi:small subunit ribosomal protein S18